MDIAKYAGLFFLKSEYVYLPGLGNLEIKKTTTGYSSETGSTGPPIGEITFRPTIGVIDDAFANFVANNERVSLASAANAISDFGKRVKAAVIDGEKVEIPGIGEFYDNGGVVGFNIQPDFEYKPKAIPIFKNVSKTEEYKKEKDIKEIIQNTHFSQPTSEDEIELEKPKVNYAKLITLILLGIGVLVGIGFLISSLMTETNSTPVENQKSKDIDETTLLQKEEKADSIATAEAAMKNNSEVSIIVNEYSDTFKANARVSKLNSIPYNAKRIDTDSTIYVVVVMPNSEKGGQFLADSIKPILNPRYDVRVLN